VNDLLTKGFVVIPNFLSSLEIDYAMCDYEASLLKGPKNKNYAVLGASQTIRELLSQKISNMIDLVYQQTDIKADLKTHCAYWATDQVSLEWHQDHENYFIWQNLYHSLNFWIPIQKPIPHESGLSIIPFDRFPENMNRLVERGATRYKCQDSRTSVYDDENDTTFDLDLNIEDLKITPQLNVGDLLLLRGDIIHRTQDTNTSRVALSIRSVDGSREINKEKMFSGGKVKKQLLSGGGAYDKLINKFSQKKTIKISEFYR